VEDALALVEAVEQQIENATVKANQVDRSVLAKAFRGELVPQDPNDEPAAVLLERIRSERANAPKTKKRGRRRKAKA